MSSLRGKSVSSNAMSIVQEHYGRNAPAWIIALAEECDRTTQTKVAGRIGRSASLINQVLKNKYTGNLEGIRQRVDAVLRPSCFQCPVLGEISGDDCLKHQGKPYNPANNLAVRLFLACRKCPNRIVKCEKDKNHDQ